MRTDIELQVEDGTTLRGYLHAASAGVAAPGIVMAHGFSGVKEQIDHYAVAFADAGFSVLVYDHRGFGGSDGSPRYEVDPYRQLADWRDVLTLALDLPEFDAERGVGVWGSSFAGGIAVVLAANDPRVRCVVAQIPNVGGHLNSRLMFGPIERRRFEKALDEDRRARLRGEAPAMVPVFTTDREELCALPPVMSQRFIDSSYEGGSTWRNEVTLRSVEHLMDFEPMGWIAHVAPTPLLMIVGERDICTFPQVQLLAYEQAREPKKLLVHQSGHFQTYNEPYFEQTSGVATEWFAEHL